MAKAGEISIFLNANTTKFDAGIAKGISGIKKFTEGFANIHGALAVFQQAMAAAIESGTVAAYQAIQRAQRDDEAKRISKQQLEEQRKQTKTLDSIFQAMELGFDVVTIGLQS